MNLIIDRLEGEFAVVELENKATANLPACLLPAGAKEGDVLRIEIDHEQTNSRKKQIEKLMGSLWED